MSVATELTRRYDMDRAIHRAQSICNMQKSANVKNQMPRDGRVALVWELVRLEPSQASWLDALLQHETSGMEWEWKQRKREQPRTDKHTEEVCKGVSCLGEGRTVYCTRAECLRGGQRPTSTNMPAYDCWSSVLRETVLINVAVPVFAHWLNRRFQTCETPSRFELEIWCRWFPMPTKRVLAQATSPLEIPVVFALFLHAWAHVVCHRPCRHEQWRNSWFLIWKLWYFHWTQLPCEIEDKEVDDVDENELDAKADVDRTVDKDVVVPLPLDLLEIIRDWSEAPEWINRCLWTELAPYTTSRGLLISSLSRILQLEQPLVSVRQWPILLSFLVDPSVEPSATSKTTIFQQSCTRDATANRSLLVAIENGSASIPWHNRLALTPLCLRATWPIDYLPALLDRLEKLSKHSTIPLFVEVSTMANVTAGAGDASPAGHCLQITNLCAKCRNVHVKHRMSCHAHPSERDQSFIPFASRWAVGHWKKVQTAIEHCLFVGRPVTFVCDKPSLLERDLLDWFARTEDDRLVQHKLQIKYGQHVIDLLPPLWVVIQEYLRYSLYNVITIRPFQ